MLFAKNIVLLSRSEVQSRLEKWQQKLTTQCFLQCDAEIDQNEHRINTGWMKWRQLTVAICDRSFSLKSKGKIYKIIRPDRPVWIWKLTHQKNGWETPERSWIANAEMDVSRNLDGLKNEYMRGSLEVASLDDKKW